MQLFFALHVFVIIRQSCLPVFNWRVSTRNNCCEFLIAGVILQSDFQSFQQSPFKGEVQGSHSPKLHSFRAPQILQSVYIFFLLISCASSTFKHYLKAPVNFGSPRPPYTKMGTDYHGIIITNLKNIKDNLNVEQTIFKWNIPL